MVSVGDTFSHERYGDVEVLDVEQKMIVERTGSTSLEERVKFLRLKDDLARENFLRQSLDSFKQATAKLES
jgi:hypothetical protein